MIETDHASYSGSDDDTLIESDQPLFFDTVPQVKTKNTRNNNNDDPILGCDEGTDDDSVMAEFLKDTFDSNALGSKNRAVPTLEGVMNTNDMDALLMAEHEELMLFPDL